MTARPKSVFLGRLETAPTCPLDDVYVRRVPKDDFDRGVPPSYLYTSAAANRLNPAGVHALYLSVGEPTSLAEYEAGWAGTSRVRYPSVAHKRRGKNGWNVVVFRNAVTAPDRVEILGARGKIAEAWP